jgi:hypothetical protein
MPAYDPTQLAAMHAQCLASGTAAGKGKALEDLVEHVFLAVPSVQLVARDVKDDSGAQEIDFVLTHHLSVSRIPIPDVTILIECKNEATKTSADQITRFAAKLKSRVLPIGILVTRLGLSGTKKTHAHSAIRDILTTGTAVIVVQAGELVALRNTLALTDLLRDRLNELRTYRGYQSI